MTNKSDEEGDASNRTRQPSRPITSQKQIPQYALISLVAFLCCLIVLVLFIANADRLSRFGFLQQVYYLVLVLMGLTASVCLFGVLPSSASWAGKVIGGNLRLSGSIVGAALVVIGGIYFTPKPTFFPLTVYVHGEGGPQDLVLRNKGRVLLKLGPEISPELIGENGQAVFPRIPADLRGQAVPGWVESDDYEALSTTLALVGSNVDLVVKKKIKHFSLAGTVLDEQGKPLSGVHVALPKFHLDCSTKSDGGFEFQVIADGEEMVDLTAEKKDYQTRRLSPTLGDTAVNFGLKGAGHAVP